MDPANASSFRRMGSGLCLLVGPALLLVASIVDPSENGGDGDRKYLQSLKDDPDMVQLSSALFVVGFALMVIGIVGVVHVIRHRGVVLANIGGLLAILGMIFFVALSTTTITDLNAAEHLEIATAERLSDDIEDYWAAYVVLVPALLGTFFGFILLAIALIRSRFAHIAAPIMILVGIAFLVFGEGSDAVNIAANALLLGGFGMVGLKILGLTDEQWDGRAPLEGPPPPAPVAAPPSA